MPLTKGSVQTTHTNDTVQLPAVAIDRNLGVKGTAVFEDAVTVNSSLTARAITASGSISALSGSVTNNFRAASSTTASLVLSLDTVNLVSPATSNYVVPTDGVYLSNFNEVSIRANGSNRITLPSTGGLVALPNSSFGASFPSTNIHTVNIKDNFTGAISIRASDATELSTTSFYNSTGSTLYGTLTASSSSYRLSAPSGIPLEFSQNGTVRLSLTTAGEVNSSTNVIIGGTLSAGSSTNKTTAYPVAPTGTTSGTVTQAAQLAGYIGMPQNAQATSGTFAYTFAASDAGKHIYATGTPTSVTLTIPANSAVAFEIGTTFVVMNDLGAATNISIAITTDTLQLAGTGTTGTRTLARYGVASITKVTSTKWIISGNGLT